MQDFALKMLGSMSINCYFSPKLKVYQETRVNILNVMDNKYKKKRNSQHKSKINRIKSLLILGASLEQSNYGFGDTRVSM